MAKLYADLCWVSTATTGTGTMTLGAAVPNYRGVAALTNGASYSYSISDATGTAFETGLGLYTSSNTTLTRATVYSSSNSNAAIALSGNATVIVGSPLAADMASLAPLVSPVLTTPTLAASPTNSDSSLAIANTAWARMLGNSTNGQFAAGSSVTLPATAAGSNWFITASGVTLTLPLANTIAAGSNITIYSPTYAFTVARQGSDYISTQLAGSTAQAPTVTSQAYPLGTTITFYSDGSGRWYEGVYTNTYAPKFYTSPTVVTAPAATDSSLSLATTAWVKGFGASTGGVFALASSSTLTTTSLGASYLISASGLTATMPVASTFPVGGMITFTGIGYGFTIARQSTNVIVAGLTGSAVLSPATTTVTYPVGTTVTFFTDGSSKWYEYAHTNTYQPKSYYSPQVVSGPAITDNSLTLATTSYARSIAGALSSVNVVSVSTTFTVANQGQLIYVTSAGNTMKLPVASTVPSGMGMTFTTTQGALVQTQGTDTMLLSSSSYAASITNVTLTAGDTIDFVSDGSSKWYEYVRTNSMKPTFSQGVYIAAAPATGDSSTLVPTTAWTKSLVNNPLTTNLKQYTETTVALGTVTANFTIDFSQGSVFTVTIGAAVQLTFAGLTAGSSNSATVYITNGGAYAWTYATAVKSAGGVQPTLSTSGEDIVTFTTPDGTTGNMHVILGGKAFA